MPRFSYEQGYGYCSICGIRYSPFEMLTNQGRCQCCGKKIRGDLNLAIQALHKVTRVLRQDDS